MSGRSRRVFAILGAVFVAAICAEAASAYEFQFNPGGRLTGTSLGQVIFSTEGFRASCSMTLAGTITSARTPLVAGTSYGSIESAGFTSCDRPIAILRGTPWPVIYNGILGTLPEAVTATDLTLEGVSFSIRTEIFGTCLYGGDIRGLLAVSGRNPYVSTLYEVPPNTVPFVSGPFFCPRSGRFSGTFSLAPTQTITIF